MRPPIAARATSSGSRAPSREMRACASLSPRAVTNTVPAMRDAIARRRASPLDRHRGGHRAAGPAHLRADERARRRRVLELRAPLRAMRWRRRGIARRARRSRAPCTRPPSRARPSPRVIARCDEQPRSPRTRCRTGMAAAGRAEKSGNEPRGVGEDGDRDERHRSRSRRTRPRRIGARGCSAACATASGG